MPGASARRALIAVAAVVLAVALYLGFSRRAQKKVTLRIATGQRGGTFLPLGEALAKAFGGDLKNVSPTVLESPGSNASVEMLEKGDVEIALVSSNSQAGGRVTLIAPLYPETLQIVVRKSANVAAPGDLAGKRISIGPAGSGTETIAWQVMTHFGLRNDQVQARNMALLEAVDALEKSTLDVAFVVAGMRASAVAAIVPGAVVNVVSDPAQPSRVLLDLRERPTDPAMRGIPIPNPRDALEDGRGVPGAAWVLQITGGKQRSFDSHGLTYNVSFLLEVDGPRRYLTHIYQVVGERHLPLVQVGASVPIRIDPSQPEHVAIAF